MDFRLHSVRDLAASVRAGSVTARELAEAALRNIESDDLNAFVASDAERALADADAVDEVVARGDDPGSLAGVPVGVKDVHDAVGYVTTSGCSLFADRPPAEVDSVIVARMKAAGAVVVGKTNTPEMGWTGVTENPLFGATLNPWDRTRAPGGSSGGSAAAVAGGLVPLATGSDGGGSLRIPGAACGLSVMKPSLGRIPNFGPEPPDWVFLSTAGPVVREARDVAHVLDALVGPHPADLYSLPAEDRRWSDVGAGGSADGLRVGWSPDLGYARVDDEVARTCEAAVKSLEAAGWEVVPVDGVFEADPVFAWQTLASTFFLRTMGPHRDRWDELSDGFQEALGWGDEITGVQVIEAQDEAARMAARLAEVFAGVDLLLCPTIAGIVPWIGELSGTVDGEVARNWVQLTYGFNMTRSPAATVMAGLTHDGLPVGLQMVGPLRDDATVLAALARAEDVLGSVVG